jgi:uncharacterized membrane protein
MVHRFMSTAFFVWSGLLIWMGNFLFVYVFAALACARRFSQLKMLGFGIVPFVTTVSSILATVAILAIMARAARRLHAASHADPHSRFIGFVTMGTAALTLIALAWVALPPLITKVDC